MKKRTTFLRAFSLAEMMVVMLVVAIILAATAPMITKKVSSNRKDQNKLWEKVSGSPAYVTTKLDNNLKLSADFSLFPNEGLGLVKNNTTIPKSSVVVGTIQSGSSIGERAVGMGYNVIVDKESVSIGQGAKAKDSGSCSSSICSSGSVAVGLYADASGKASTAIGRYTVASGEYSTAIGKDSKARGKHSVAIGPGAVTNQDGTIVLGTQETTVHIPGRLLIGSSKNEIANQELLLVRGHIAFAMLDDEGKDEGIMDPGSDNAADNSHQYDSHIFPGSGHVRNRGLHTGRRPRASYLGDSSYEWNNYASLGYKEGTYTYDPSNADKIDINSDIRLKDVGEKYTAGLDEISKLDLYHYTYKNDEKKTPQVGVIAQDLQKIFPTAVTTGVDGYLRIRWDEMFYATINAVKQLNEKVVNLAKDVLGLTEKYEQQQAQIEEQQKTIDTLQETLNKQQVLIEDLSKKVQKIK